MKIKYYNIYILISKKLFSKIIVSDMNYKQYKKMETGKNYSDKM